MTTPHRAAASSMRHAVARTVTESKSSIPHFYVSAEADVTDLGDRLRSADADGSRGRVTMTAALVFGLASALSRHPRLNGHWVREALSERESINIGVAMPVGDGLVAPAILGCERLSLSECAQRLEDLKARAIDRRIRREELAEATVTLSNLGRSRVRSFSAIIVPPQIAIVAVGSATAQPRVVDGRIEPRTVMEITTSADHRAVDGVDVASFLDDLVDTLESPLWVDGV